MTTYQIQTISHRLRAMQACLRNILVLGCDTLQIILSRKIHMVCYFHSVLFSLRTFKFSHFPSISDIFDHRYWVFKLFWQFFGHFWPQPTKNFYQLEGVVRTTCLIKNMATPVFDFCTFVLFWFDSSCQTISYFVSYNESENLKTSADPCKSCKRQLKRLKLTYS